MNETQLTGSDNEPQGPEGWVREAIAQQEEYLRRIRACEITGGSHSWEWFAPRPVLRVQQCWRCQVTRTDEDYQAILDGEA